MSAAPGLRVMMTTDTVGGVWIYATALARSLGAIGSEVLLVTLGPRPTEIQKATLRGCPGVSLIETDLQLEWQDPAGTDLCNAEAVLGTIADRFTPDLIHLNSFREATFDWTVPVIVVAHSCVNSWADACGETEAFIGDDWKVYSLFVEAALRSADAWVTPTRAFGEQLVALYGPSAKRHVIWNGVDIIRDDCATKMPFVLSAGRLWDKAKNLSAISAAAADIDWPVKIAGPAALQTWTGSSALTNSDCINCEFLGEISQAALLREMRSASIFVSPALYEPFGLSVLEAAGAGCALLLSDLPTFRELWEGAALFFDPRDPDQLLCSLRSLCGDERQRARLQRAAARRAERYGLSGTVNGYRSLYASLLGGEHGIASIRECGEMLA
jgi:glycosyltransferase involved in cell wall biosynthesis